MTVMAALSAFSVASAATKFYYNQVGYDVGQPVSIVVESDQELSGTPWTLSNTATDPYTAVATGTFTKGANPDNWSKTTLYFNVDLGNTLPAGIYSLTVGTTNSGSIKVAENALAANTLKSVMDYFYKDRADKSPVEGWDKKVEIYGSGGKTRDVHGGWYDASGDVSKYLSHLSYANNLNPQQIPLTVWALAFAAEKMPTTLTANPSTVTAVDESIYGADFLVRMQDEEGFFYMTVFDNWGSGDRYLCAFSGSDGIKSADYKTAFREGGGMAIAALARASTLGKNGDYTSEQYLEAAIKGFEHLQKKQTLGGTCEYCDDNQENIIDDYTALLAATELYNATKEVAYKNEASARAAHLSGRLSEEGYFWSDNAKARPFWHASDAGLPLVALCRYVQVFEGEAQILVAIEKHLAWLLNVTNETENPFGYARQTYKTQGAIKNGFFIPHDNESKYWWQGEDARIASLSAAAFYAAKTLGEKRLTNAWIKTDAVNKFATDQLDWILGKNPYGVCMMYGKGLKNPAKYNGTSPYDATLEGGIANGISGKNVDGSGIVWDNVSEAGFPADEPWNNWRWIEQWLPHSTWYLMALAARYDEVTKPVEGSDGIGDKLSIAKFSIKLQGRILAINLKNNDTQAVTLYDMTGREILRQQINGKAANLNLTALKNGLYVVKVGSATQRIAIK